MMGSKVIVVDAKDHLLGRLASVVAKQLLTGQEMVVVRCEEICISGSLFRAKMKYKAFLRKRTLTNPRRGPFHFRAPSKIFWRTVRGMIPHKTKRGAQAMNRLKVFEGIPEEWTNAERVNVPFALREARLRPDRKWAVLGALSHEVGWGYRDIVAKLEAKREAAELEKRTKAEKSNKTLTSSDSKTVAEIDRALAALGY